MSTNAFHMTSMSKIPGEFQSCPLCHEESYIRVKQNMWFTPIINDNGERGKVHINGLEMPYCENCKEYFFDSKAVEAINQLYDIIWEDYNNGEKRIRS